MKTSSAKAKGRRLQQHVAQRIKETFKLTDDDVFWRSMGAAGTDIYFSNDGKKAVPFDIEAKCVEALNIWSAMEQAEANTAEGRIPLVVFKRNRSEAYACLPFEKFLALMGMLNDYFQGYT